MVKGKIWRAPTLLKKYFLVFRGSLTQIFGCFLYATVDDIVLSCLNLFNNLDLATVAFLKYLITNAACLHLTCFSFNPIQDGPFRGCSRMGGKGHPSLKSVTHILQSTMMKLGTVIPYLSKTQKLYESRNTPLEFCWHQHFPQEIGEFCYIKKHIISHPLIHNFSSFQFFLSLLRLL